MRKTVPLAIAALAVALAGCTGVPSAPEINSSLSAPQTANSVTFHTLGLLSGKLDSAKAEKGQSGRLVSAAVLNDALGHIVPSNSVVPTGATLVTFLKHPLEGDHYIAVGAAEDATHLLYRFDSLRQEDLDALSVTLGEIPSSSEVPATIRRGKDGKVRIAYPDPGKDYWAFAKVPEGGSLRFISPLNLGENEPDAYMAWMDSRQISWTLFHEYRVTADVTLKDAKGAPLSGLKRENFDFDMTVTMSGTPTPAKYLDMTLDVTETQAGKYRFTADLMSYTMSAPSAYSITLGIRNAPLVHDVEY